MLDRAQLNICCYSSGDRSNVCWIQHKISREFPLWHESSHYMDQLTIAGWSCCLLLARKFPPSPNHFVPVMRCTLQYVLMAGSVLTLMLIQTRDAPV